MPTYLSPGVYVEEVESGSRPIEGVGTAVAAFVGLAKTGPVDTPTLVTNWKQFVSIFGDFNGESYLAHAVYGYFLNGGGNCYVVRVAAEDDTQSQTAQLLAIAEESPQRVGDEQDASTRYEIKALPGAPLGEDLVVEVIDITDSDLTKAESKTTEGKASEGKSQGKAAGTGGERSSELFKLVVRRGNTVLEEFDRLSGAKGKEGAVAEVNAKSRLIQLVDAPGAPAVRPATARVRLSPSATQELQRLSAADYVGDSADRTGFGGLETIDEITMVCVPDAMAAYQKGWIDLEGLSAVQAGMIAHCELMGDRVAIIDPPPDMNAQRILDWRKNGAGYDSKYAAMYWPWVNVFDPATNASISVPPSGYVAGVWGRNDDTRGVHKAPANEVIRGAVSLTHDITSREQELLNPEGINCIRSFSGRGIRIWGARTLSSDPAWRYINVRRLFNYLEESILNGTQWVVFEPNDDALWARIRRTISAFLMNEWRKGALFGLTPDEAFFVKCDRETNPPEGIDAGQVVCEVGVAPTKPAEFVIFRLSQFTGGAALTE